MRNVNIGDAIDTKAGKMRVTKIGVASSKGQNGYAWRMATLRPLHEDLASPEYGRDYFAALREDEIGDVGDGAGTGSASA